MNVFNFSATNYKKTFINKKQISIGVINQFFYIHIKMKINAINFSDAMIFL